MAILNAPSLSAIRRGDQQAIDRGIEILGLTHQHLRNPDVAKAVFQEGGQYDDFIRDVENGLQRILTHGFPKVVGQILNYSGQLDTGRITDQDLRNEISGRYQEVKENLANNANHVKNYIGPLIEAGFLSPAWIDSYNGALQQALELWPQLKSDLRELEFIPGGSGNLPSAQDFVNQVTGGGTVLEKVQTPAKATNTSIDPTTYTGWMKAAYAQAENGTGNILDYVPDFVKNNASYMETTKYMQQALDSGARIGGASSEPNGQGADGTNGQAVQGGGVGIGAIGSDRSAREAEALTRLKDQYDAGNLSYESYLTFSDAVKNWDPNKELNVPNLLDTFQKIKNETIDPYYRGLVNMSISQIQNSQESIQKQRAIELESEGMARTADVDAVRKDLEARGMTFSGEGQKLLGRESALASGGAGRNIPFGGPDVEGTIPKKHRLIASSSAARNKQQIQDLGLGAESTLGSERVAGLVSGYNPVGSVTGDIEESRQSREASTLSNIISQQGTNRSQDELMDFTSSV